MTAFVVTLIVGLGTYLTRASFILTLADRTLPPVLLKAMRNVGPAVLSALVASLVVGTEGVAGLEVSPETVALAVAGIVAWRTKNVVITLVVGMVAIWILQALW